MNIARVLSFFRLYLIFNASSLIVAVFLVKEEITDNSLSPYFESLPAIVTYIFYLVIPAIEKTSLKQPIIFDFEMEEV